jgi:hypothetical protein
MRSRCERTLAAVLGSLIALWLVAYLSDVRAQSSLVELVRESQFIVEGTVSRLGQGTMPIVPDSENIITLRVDHVYQAPQALTRLVGDELTVLVKDPVGLQINERMIFFARGWLIGDGIAVEEVGRLSSPGADLANRIASAQEDAADQVLSDRMSEAELVIAGRVIEIRAWAPPAGVSEHNPNWQEAVVGISAVLKGDTSLTRVGVLFPASLDVAWATAPKFQIGQEGIWILRREPAPNGYTALDAQDFRPASESSRIRRLLGAAR